MHARGSWLVLLGTVGAACATAIPLDGNNGSPVGLFDGSFGNSPDATSYSGASNGGDLGTGGMSTGGYVAPTGGRANTGGRIASAGGSDTGGRGNAGGSGGTLPNTGGRAETGGAPTGGVSGGGPTGGAPVTDAGGCKPDEKYCGGVCTQPAPGIGCDLGSSCTACPGPAPANGVLSCDKTNHTCDFVCFSGFTKQGSSCVSSTGGGGGGSTSTGGSTGGGGCNASSCPDCGIALGNACCKPNNGGCGCPFFHVPGSCF